MRYLRLKTITRVWKNLQQFYKLCGMEEIIPLYYHYCLWVRNVYQDYKVECNTHELKSVLDV